MIDDEKFGKGRLQAMVRNIEKEIPFEKEKVFKQYSFCYRSVNKI